MAATEGQVGLGWQCLCPDLGRDCKDGGKLFSFQNCVAVEAIGHRYLGESGGKGQIFDFCSIRQSCLNSIC